jgi:diguanylate cyclase (GGDEF)-like protein
LVFPSLWLALPYIKIKSEPKMDKRSPRVMPWHGLTLKTILPNLSVRLRLRLLLFLLVGLFVSLALSWAWETRRHLENLNAQARLSKKMLVEQVIYLKSEQLAGLVYDYGCWDDLLTYLETGDPSWARKNLLSVLKGQAADGIWIYRRDGKRVLERFRSESQALDLDERSVLLLQPARRAVRWYVAQEGAVWELYGTTIHRGEDAQHREEHFGYIVMGRLLGDRYQRELAALSQCKLTLRLTACPADESHALAVDTPLRDANHIPVAVLHAQMYDTLAQLIENSVTQIGTYFIWLALLTGSLLGFCLLRWIGRPVDLLAKALEARDPQGLTPLLTQQTEFGDLARLALDFFVQEQVLIRSRDELELRVEERTEALAHQAYHDALTGLPNRVRFREQLDAALERLASGGKSSGGLAVLFVDMDNFKVINDSLGHDVGDQVLCQTAERMVETLRSQDCVARLSGDEFAILLPELKDVDQAQQIATRLHEVFQGPLLLQEHRLFVTLSIGLAPWTGRESATDLLRNADTAMYVAKSRGKAGVALFDSSMKQQADRRLELESGLRQALSHDPEQLYVVFQPIFALETGGISELEALVRWNHPTLGPISPLEFIPIAEEAELIRELGKRVLAESSRQVGQWNRQLGRALRLSVNLSARQLQAAGIVEELLQTLQDAPFPPQLLALEVTESVMMQHPELVADRLTRLREHGVMIAVDDFGTGYSSMSVLAQLPMDAIKIDQSFVRRLESGSDAVAIVQAIIELAHTLQLQTIGEGIETEAQWKLLQRLGCEEGQGYFFSHPLTAPAMEIFLQNQSPSKPSLAKAA